MCYFNSRPRPADLCTIARCSWLPWIRRWDPRGGGAGACRSVPTMATSERKVNQLRRKVAGKPNPRAVAERGFVRSFVGSAPGFAEILQFPGIQRFRPVLLLRFCFCQNRGLCLLSLLRVPSPTLGTTFRPLHPPSQSPCLSAHSKVSQSFGPCLIILRVIVLATIPVRWL